MEHKTIIVTIAVFYSFTNSRNSWNALIGAFFKKNLMLQFWQPNANQRAFET